MKYLNLSNHIWSKNEDKVKNELASEKGRRVLCDSFSFDDYSYNLDSSGFDLDSYSLTDGSTSNGRNEFHRMAYSSNNENIEDSRGIVNGSVAEAQPQIAGQRKPCIKRDHPHTNGVQETLKIPLKHQNGIVDYKSTQIVDNKSTQIVDNESTQATEEEDRENGASYSSPLQSASASNGFSLMTTETLSSFFDSVSLLSVGEDEAFSYEWIRLRTFSEWPLTSNFSTTLAKNGWVSLGEGDRARCYSCHVVHEGWRIGDDPDQYHSPNCRFKSGQSNNIPITRGTSNQTPYLGQISQDQQQCTSPGNPLHPGNLSGVASSVGPPDPLSAGLPTSEAVAAPTPRNTDSSRHTGTPRNTGTPTPQVPTDNLHSTAAAEAPTPHSKEAQLEALKRDPMGINFDRPKYPSYAILAVRISSYTDWPAAMTQTARDMALAGFFYAGYGDYTRCFFCGGGLRNWEAGDDPWVEHARWFKKCAFVRQNRGQEFIDLVQKRAAELDEQGNQEEVGNQQTNTAIKNTSLKDQILCKICMEKNVSIAFLPCGHLACCEDCAPAMRKCPICREFVRGTVKTFLV
uniref:Apoptosis 1 inhibitor n=1 Tax=Magallana gigas TaxID=29159 RepID=K1QB79_MAGGI